MRYLPRGSMRRQRRLGRMEGSVGTLALVLAIGAGLVAAMPAELYHPTAATVRPDPIGNAAPTCASIFRRASAPARTAPSLNPMAPSPCCRAPAPSLHRCRRNGRPRTPCPSPARSH